MFAGDSRLEGRHHAEPEIDQIVLTAEKLMCHEGGGVDVAVVGLAPVYLEQLGFQHTTGVIAVAD